MTTAARARCGALILGRPDLDNSLSNLVTQQAQAVKATMFQSQQRLIHQKNAQIAAQNKLCFDIYTKQQSWQSFLLI